MIVRDELDIAGLKLPVYSLNTVVVGSGAAGLSCAVRLFREMEEMGVVAPADEVALVTRGVGLGTSNNSGSDKQTYYKLGTHGAEPDTPVDFARTLTDGGCAHADVALAEGENSLRGFYHLVDAGVPFPHNAGGGFVGYKTDHDPRQRATSAGPWTSRFMVQKLLAELKRYEIPVFNRHHVLAVIRDDSGACGLLCADMCEQDADAHGLVLFNCHSVVMAGGGPGDLYEISVYPKGQMGPYAALFEAGAVAHNLTESQFGLASLEPRWNLSGTYQQVIPRYFSTNENGEDEREFLSPWFESVGTLVTDIFLKGYQWPFDHDRVAGYGSSLIDILVQNETINEGRRVYLDLRSDPAGFEWGCLGDEARVYLEKSGATQGLPIERLAHMNQPSIDLYAQRGVDLWKEPLPMGVCAQHCNGGFAVDAWWESTVRRLFVVGELAGTHGVKRPGGSALNAGQVGSLRAAQRIAHVYYGRGLSTEEFSVLAGDTVARFVAEIGRVKAASRDASDSGVVKRSIQRRMSEYAGMVRSAAGIREALRGARREWREIRERGLCAGDGGYLEAAETRELALAQLGFLEAIDALLDRGSGSRGSHLVTDPSGTLPHPGLGGEWRFIPENLALRGEILGLCYDRHNERFEPRVCAPNAAPAGESWFENTWNEYRSASVFRWRYGDLPKPYGIDER